MKRTAVVIPTYNESQNIELLVDAILASFPISKILIVDDNSPDGTGKIADQLTVKWPASVAVLHRQKKEGLGPAYIAGFQFVLEEWPDANHILQMDADFSHRPEYIASLVAHAESADLVVGSRYCNGISIVDWPLHRLIISQIGTAYARWVTGLPISDCTSGFKCFSRQALQAVLQRPIRSDGYAFQIETNFRVWDLGLRIVDVPIIFYNRKRGESKLNLSIASEAFFTVLRLGLSRFVNTGKGSAAVGADNEAFSTALDR